MHRNKIACILKLTVLGTIRMCVNESVLAHSEGTILSPTDRVGESLSCELQLTDLPNGAWLEIKLISAKLHRNRKDNYIQLIVGEEDVDDEQINNENDVIFHNVHPDATSATIKFFTKGFKEDHNFTLRYRGTPIIIVEAYF